MDGLLEHLLRPAQARAPRRGRGPAQALHVARVAGQHREAPLLLLHGALPHAVRGRPAGDHRLERRPNQPRPLDVLQSGGRSLVALPGAAHDVRQAAVLLRRGAHVRREVHLRLGLRAGVAISHRDAHRPFLADHAPHEHGRRSHQRRVGHAADERGLRMRRVRWGCGMPRDHRRSVHCQGDADDLEQQRDVQVLVPRGEPPGAAGDRSAGARVPGGLREPPRHDAAGDPGDLEHLLRGGRQAAGDGEILPRPGANPSWRERAGRLQRLRLRAGLCTTLAPRRGLMRRPRRRLLRTGARVVDGHAAADPRRGGRTVARVDGHVGAEPAAQARRGRGGSVAGAGLRGCDAAAAGAQPLIRHRRRGLEVQLDRGQQRRGPGVVPREHQVGRA
mmetsp:Transcript_92117/g.265103  ORF Transcript_92117/g.265103 Transcript_92117/m.265103 type:complete len:390 (-) Transcript_92117:554-1723(-)